MCHLLKSGASRFDRWSMSEIEMFRQWLTINATLLPVYIREPAARSQNREGCDSRMTTNDSCDSQLLVTPANRQTFFIPNRPGQVFEDLCQGHPRHCMIVHPQKCISSLNTFHFNGSVLARNA